MHKYAFALMAMTIPMLPLSLAACGCDDDTVGVGLGIVHFRDGRSPTVAVTGGYAAGDTEGGCGCSSTFAYRDYGPAHAPVAPPHPDVKQIVKRPSS